MPQSYASTVIAADAGEVWAFLRGFGNLAEWLPGISMCEIEGGGPPEPGAVRRMDAGGDLFRERLLSLDDEARSLTYEILQCPLPVENYRATCRVAPVTDTGQAFVEWYADFDAADPAKMAGIFTNGVFAPGLAALGKRFA
ncbi:SRPBCC family protein [Microbispora sp. NPDC049125]|uniref:SRPBCC family protein n=1 Tax=Microbispora sp. NPDC049125 TaxID=3154929 RepID=UPI003465943A